MIDRPNSKAVDRKRRLALLAEAEALMLEQQPVMPIYFYVSRRLVKPWVRRYPTSPINVQAFWKGVIIGPH